MVILELMVFADQLTDIVGSSSTAQTGPNTDLNNQVAQQNRSKTSGKPNVRGHGPTRSTSFGSEGS